MISRWTTAVLDTDLPGGWAVARSPEGFLFDDNGALFPRDWLKRQDLSILAEHGIGHLDGEPVYLLELHSSQDIPGCNWKGLRAFMLEDDHTLYKVLGYAAQIGTWARECRFCGSCGKRMGQIARERAMYCDACDLRHYPRISPSMIAPSASVMTGRSERSGTTSPIGERRTATMNNVLPARLAAASGNPGFQ